MGQIILASASPRRKELLEQIGLEFEICPAKGEEVISKSVPEEVVMELSEQKAKEVAGMVKAYESGHEKLMTPQDILVIGADTIVACDDTILGKPKDEAGAKRMLKLLSGRKHAVYVQSISRESKVTTIMWSDFLLHVFIRNCKSLELIPIYGKLHIHTITKENSV